MNHDGNHEALYEVSRQIAKHLGLPWKAEINPEMPHCAYIQGEGGSRIRIAPTQWRYDPEGRLEISGIYPHHPNRGSFTYDLDPPPPITVTAKKDAVTIAKDIRRRFLPEYLRVYHIALERKQQYEQVEAKRQDQLQQLAEIMGTEVRNGHRVYFPSDFLGYGHMQMTSAESVHLEVSSVPFEIACQVATLLVRSISPR